VFESDRRVIKGYLVKMCEVLVGYKFTIHTRTLSCWRG